MSTSEKKSTTAPKEKPIESTVAPSKAKSVGASLSTKKPSKKSVASRPPKGQKKASVTSSSPNEEQPSTASTPPPSKKKKFTAPLFPLGVASRIRSKSGSKVNFFLLSFYFWYSLLHFLILLSAAGNTRT